MVTKALTSEGKKELGMDRKGIRSAFIGGRRRRWWYGALRDESGGGVVSPPWERWKPLRCNPQHLLRWFSFFGFPCALYTKWNDWDSENGGKWVWIASVLDQCVIFVRFWAWSKPKRFSIADFVNREIYFTSLILPPLKYFHSFTHFNYKMFYRKKLCK